MFCEIVRRRLTLSAGLDITRSVKGSSFIVLRCSWELFAGFWSAIIEVNVFKFKYLNAGEVRALGNVKSAVMLAVDEQVVPYRWRSVLQGLAAPCRL